MYVNARLTSQGTQRAYNVTNIPQQRIFDGSIRRQNAIRRSGQHNFDDFNDDEDQYDTLNHKVSASVTTPYRSTSQTAVMRSVSNNTNDLEENKEDEDEEEFIFPL
jgi:hypothetical protein